MRTVLCVDIDSIYGWSGAYTCSLVLLDLAIGLPSMLPRSKLEIIHTHCTQLRLFTVEVKICILMVSPGCHGG